MTETKTDELDELVEELLDEMVKPLEADGVVRGWCRVG